MEGWVGLSTMGVNNLLKVITWKRSWWDSNPRPLSHKSETLPLRHRANRRTSTTTRWVSTGGQLLRQNLWQLVIGSRRSHCSNKTGAIFWLTMYFLALFTGRLIYSGIRRTLGLILTTHNWTFVASNRNWTVYRERTIITMKHSV